MNDSLTNILLRLFGEQTSSAEGGVQWALDGNWIWSPVAIVLSAVFVAASVVFVAYFYIRERSTAGPLRRMTLASIRLAIILLVGLLIYGLQLRGSRSGLPTIVFILDQSASMENIDDFDDRQLIEKIETQIAAVGLDSNSRFNIARSLLLADDADVMKQLSKRYKLQFYTVAGAVSKQPADIAELVEQIRQLSSEGSSSKLGTGIRDVLADLRGNRPAAMVMITDGITTDGPTMSEAATYARRKAVPLYVVGIGSERPTQSLELSNLLVDRVVFVNDFVDFDLDLTVVGLEDRSVEVALRNKTTGEEISRKTVVVGKDGKAKHVSLSDRPTQEGEVEYEIEVVTGQEDLKQKTTPLTRTIEVRKAKIKVLLVQAYPNYEYRYLKGLLERDPTIQFRCVLQDADPEYAEQDEAAMSVFPVRREAPSGVDLNDLNTENEEYLFTYDVIILGDVNPDHLSSTQRKNIVDFVKVKGGGMIVVSGEQFNPTAYRGTPLAQLLPFDLERGKSPAALKVPREGVVIRPTALGLSSPHMQLGSTLSDTAEIWPNLSQIYWMLEAPKLKPGIRVLAEHPTATGSDGRKLPLFSMSYLPPGQVLWHATDETWRWRYRLGDTFFARYWIQSIRYLSRSALLQKDQQGQNQKGQLTTDRREYQRGTPVRLQVRFFDERSAPAADDGVTVVVESLGQKKQEVKLQRSGRDRSTFEATLSNLSVDRYHAWVASPELGGTSASVNFPVLPPPREGARRTMDVAEMRLAAERSRGRYYDVTTTDQLLAELPQGRAVRVEVQEPILLWNNWRLLMLFLVLLVTEWLLRKRAGML